MKKIVIGGICALILISCSDKSDNAGTSSANSSSISHVVEQVNSINDTNKVDSSSEVGSNASSIVRHDPVKTIYINGADIIANKLKARNVSIPSTRK
ncbi:MAG: hypothetical protein RL017_396 [Pseudomonadota bacterium]